MSRTLLNYSEFGELIEDEPIVVGSGDIHLVHDTIKSGSLQIFNDEEHTVETEAFSLTLENSMLPEGMRFIAFAFDQVFIDLHDGETWYATYRTHGDVVKVEDINSRSYRYDVFEAGENLLSNKVVCLKNGKLYYASSSDIATINVLGITRQAGSTGDMLEVYLNGEISDSSFSFDTAKDIFVGISGSLTQTPPSVGYSGVIAKPITESRVKIVEFIPVIL